MLLLEWADERRATEYIPSATPGADLIDTLLAYLDLGRWYDPETNSINEGLNQLAEACIAATKRKPRHENWLMVVGNALERAATLPRNDLEYISYLLSPAPEEQPTPDRLLRLFDAMLAQSADANEWTFTSPIWLTRLIQAIVGPSSVTQSDSTTLSPEQFLTRVAEYVASTALRGDSKTSVVPYDVRENEHESLLGLTRFVLSQHAGRAHTAAAREDFDLFLVNPPFGATIARELRRRSHSPTRVADPEHFFIKCILERLAPKARAVIVVPAGFLTRDSAKPVRRQLIENGHLEAVISLPNRTFPTAPNVTSALLVLSGRGVERSVQFIDGSSLQPPGRKRGKSTPNETSPLVQVKWDPADSLLHLSRGSSSEPGLPCKSWLVPAIELAANQWKLEVSSRVDDEPYWLHSELGEALLERGAVSGLLECAGVRAGLYVKAKYLQSGHRPAGAPGYLRISDLADGRINEPELWIAADYQKPLELLAPGNIVLSRSGTIDKAAVIEDAEPPAIAGGGLYVIEVNLEQLDPRFLVAYFHSEWCRDWLKSHSIRTLYPNLTKETLSKLAVPTPPLAVQAEAARQASESGRDVIACLAEMLGVSLAVRPKKESQHD